MFNIRRNQVIITILVFMIAVAAYLNSQDMTDSVTGNYLADNTVGKGNEIEENDFFAGYDESQYTSAQADSQADSQTAQNDGLSTADIVDSSSFTATISKKDSLDTEENVAASSSLDANYFAEEKLLREQSRAEQIEQLTQYVANENINSDDKSLAAANLLEIQERIEKESSAEALLRAKGFEDVYVRIDDDTVDVVVNKAELSDTDIAQIEEIVNRKTGYSVGKINITPLKGIKNEG